MNPLQLSVVRHYSQWEKTGSSEFPCN